MRASSLMEIKGAMKIKPLFRLRTVPSLKIYILFYSWQLGPPPVEAPEGQFLLN